MKKLLLSCFVVSSLFANAQTNNALSFDGSNYVEVTAGTALDATKIKTMECWVKFNTLAGSQEILSKSVTSQGIELLVFGGNLAAYFMGNGAGSWISYPTSNLSTGVWYHVAISWDGTKESIRLYVNGVSVGTRADNGNINVTGLLNPAGNFRIGDWADPSNRFLNGQVDEVRIWNVNRTAEQIKAAMFDAVPDQTGLVAYYKMNQPSGSTLTNSTSTAGLNGTLKGTGTTPVLPSWVASPIARKGNALSFNSGSSTYINLGNSSTLKPASRLTIEMTVQAANWGSTTEQELISSFESAGYGIYVSGGNLIFQVRPTGAAYSGVSYPVSNLTNNTWYHLAGTFDGQYIKLYVNGLLVGTQNLGSSKTIYYINNDFIIGADAGPVGGPIDGLYFTGQIDEVRFWNTVRTQEQIQANMNRELNPADDVQTDGLVSYYTFNQGTAAGTNTGLTTVIDQKGTNNGRLINFALTGTTTNYTAQRSELFVLPVSYRSFTAQAQGKQVKLQWSTAQEQNTSHFVLQHSTDNSNWTSIGTVQAAGNSSDIRFYDYTHTTPAVGLNLYRIMQVDKGGKSNYTPVVKMNFNSSTAGVKVLYNYVNDNKVQVQLDKAASVALYSQDGKLLWQKQLAAGLQTVDVSGFAKGIYLLKSGNYTEKIMLQ